MDSKDKATITRLLNRFEKAVRTYTFRGSADPSEVSEIEEEYKAAKEDIRRWMEGVANMCDHLRWLLGRS